LKRPQQQQVVRGHGRFKTYRAQLKNELTEANWSDVPCDVAASGATASKEDGTPDGSVQSSTAPSS